MTTTNVPAKILDGAKVLMDILERVGPGPKTGLSGEIALALGKSVSPRDFADMVHHCRRVLGPQAGKAIVWSHRTGQYGFAEDIEAVEKYVLLRNNRYAATRAETMAAVCAAGITQHGNSMELSMSRVAHESYARTLRTLTENYEAGTKVERGAFRTGSGASVQLEERLAA